MHQSSFNPTRSPDPWAALFIAHDTPVSLSTGQVVTVNLRVKNAGANAWLQTGTTPIHIGYKWFDRSGQLQQDVDDRRTALPDGILAGIDVEFGAVLVAPRVPGLYHLRWDVIAEGLMWFADAGNPPLIVPVVVTALPNNVSGWRVESNLNPGEVAYALDGDPRTFWDSRTPQAPGQWFRLNLSTPRVIDGIQFLSPGKGFPAGYVLRVSEDGNTWTELARVQAQNAHDVMAVFTPQRMQYIQIDLLSTPGSGVPWQISEILIHPATPWVASASHNPEGAAQAVDNRAETAWDSKAPQAPGMWFQIGLGQMETVSGLTFCSSGERDPASFRISTWNARANRWQIVCEKSSNRAQVDVTFAATETQFINIQILKPDDRAWIIRQVHVGREMNGWLGPGTSS